ncbi:UNVERIFIED_CONTAM: protein MAINTENANCE OF MERISTEMS [Sesamum calycinum]|uniref:Protein MAINTENANCE OF MERISTEMS n=1 Tax=Sesamum calycinum TaxID=2727403 RepID=A0AAW2SEV0_9LAMI
MATQSQELISNEQRVSGRNYMQYIGFAPEEGALKGSRLQYARAVALFLLGGTMCPNSSGNLVSLLYLAKLEDIAEAKNYSWGSAILAFLYRELCNASTKGKVAIGGALQLVQTQQVNTLEALFQCTPVDVEGYRQLVAQVAHEVQIIKKAITHQPQQIATPSDTAPTTSHRQRRSSSQMSIDSVERGDIGVDIVDPSTAYTAHDYYVPQPPQDYYVPQPSQDDWFQSTSYMLSHAEAYSSYVDLDIGLGINQPYAPGYKISPFPFPSFSAYRDNVESSSAASSSGLHINSDGDDNNG